MSIEDLPPHPHLESLRGLPFEPEDAEDEAIDDCFEDYERRFRRVKERGGDVVLSLFQWRVGVIKDKYIIEKGSIGTAGGLIAHAQLLFRGDSLMLTCHSRSTLHRQVWGQEHCCQTQFHWFSLRH
jgi:hypothetical protein